MTAHDHGHILGDGADVRPAPGAAQPVEVRLSRRSATSPTDDLPPVELVDSRWHRAQDRARLAAFFARLAVKEHVAPRLHVRPLVAELFVTENCNLKCVSCNCWRESTRDELSTEEWFDVIDQLGAAGIIKANFTGGEPLLRADTPLLMRRAVAAGITDLHLNTNSILLDDRRREAVLAAGVRSFNISVDGATAELHDRFAARTAPSTPPWPACASSSDSVIVTVCASGSTSR